MRKAKTEVSNQRFIGLQWKSFLWLSMLLLCLSSAFYALNYHSLIAQFNAQRESEVRSLRHHIRGLFTGTSDRLIRLGGALASMSDLGRALASKDQDKISTFVANYSSLRYELDVRRLDIYTTEAGYDLIRSWLPSDEKLPDDYLRNAMEKVKEGEKPFTLLYCQPLCLLHAFVPILSEGKNVGVISLGQSIADFIIDFHLITGADIALAVPADTSGAGTLSGWGMRVPALTDPPKLTALLKHISEIYHNPLELEDGQLIEWRNSSYDVHHLALDKIIPGQQGFIILISDVSKRLHDIQHALNQAMLATAGGLVAAELMLLYLIRVPLRRLGRFALTLPLLAEGAYDQARDKFSAHRNSVRFRDEIDFLYDSAVTLSHQLEQNSDALDMKNKELAEERDFIQGLLASAQVLVITQTRSGIIRIGNDFAAHLIGYHPSQLQGLKFVDLIADTDSKHEVVDKLEALCNNGQRRMEHELEMLCRNGELRRVIWVHTPLHEEYTDGTAVLSVGLDVTERVRAESRMRWLANHDPLTSLVNRHRFIEDLTHTYDEVTRTAATAALLVFDLDHFKEVNDTSGHAAGDALLCMIADELRSRARTSDIIARLGGDEFAILMPQTDSYGAETFAKQLNDRWSDAPFIFGEKRYKVGASIGIALLPEHGANIHEVMANADLAMYEAKRAGRSRARVFAYEHKQGEAIKQNVYWKDVLTQAIAKDHLFFDFQPVVDAKTGETVYCEALLRLRMANGRIALPGEFMPAAERAGLNYDLDYYVVKTVLHLLLTDSEKRLSVNLSTAALNDSGWTKMLEQAVQNQYLSPDRVIFEITETAVIADMEKARQITEEVISLGFSFAVDDFGAGFSSLYYLKHLPVAYVKIDRSLIKNLVNNKEDYAFVRAITTMIHAYGKKVVCVGVENAATLELLRDMGIDLLQGFHIGQPGEDANYTLTEALPKWSRG
ncbi:PAS domain S-box/diguanylate cyclase (GGDEF) domain-containing protein [Candidatus Methylobacter favarea]|uniref:PAS domain S-box/diguanylate cyclase (GGDEF) domain-containing protein n=1 Tax=Candidatus Methylobacter favarea TaxID=2707345 RepID=A0A8S0WSD1_9GAMM|nr:EAL domain-containing protein [Candidatus Methylobacter favarea]CAA9892631.1 PAS domain S-box/diguanylate cyclase (GGDEF) domain-containing protein [Candidatus Methylobacter favarea]